MTNKSIRDYINLIENAQREDVAEGLGQKPTITYKDYTLQYDYQTEDDDPEGYSTATTYYFDVFKDSKRVGEAEYFDYFGDLTIRIDGKTKKFEHTHPLASQVSRLVSSLPDEQKRDLSDPKFESQGVAEGFLGDREYNRVMPFVKRIAGEVSDYDRDEFGEELWSLLDQKYGSKFAQSVLNDLDFYWDTYTELTGQGLDEASVYKKNQDLSSIPTQELEAFVRKHWFGGIPTYGQGESVKRAMRELKRRQKQGVAEEQLEETTPDAIAKIEQLTRN